MSETKIKICGLTNPHDARLCAVLRVDMLGLNFSPQSARCIDAIKAREIVAEVRGDFPQVKIVGVFVDQPLDLVQRRLDDLQLDGVQLHGNETPQFVRSARAPFRIKALRVAPDFRLTSGYDCEAILLDTWSPDRVGGTGETFDWSVAVEMRERVRKLILAGGLNAENVAEAIRVVQPFAVDVCSGVEDSAGQKSELKLRRFVEAVRKEHESAIAT